jgi:hypothetical protein
MLRLRTRVTKGAGNRQAAVVMAYKLLDTANTGGDGSAHPSSCPCVRACATVIDGKLQERHENPNDQSDQDTAQECAA